MLCTSPQGTISFAYDANGNPETVTEGAAVLTRTFDTMDRVATYEDAAGNEVEYAYDLNGNLTTLTYPDDKTVTYTYDSHNRLKTVTDWAGRVTTYHWDKAGRMTGIDRPNGTSRANTYTDGDELDHFFEYGPNQTNLLAYARFGYDLDSRLDWRYRLPMPQEVTEQALPDFVATYDFDNRVATWNSDPVIHDADGNMTHGPLPGVANFVDYTFDARNRLAGVDGTTYTYDAEDNRIAITNAGGTTNFVLDPHGDALPRVLVRTKPDGTVTRYVYGIGLLYQVDQAGNATYYHYDQSGSTIALTNGSGAVTDRVEYSPFGTITYREGTTDTPFLYAGQFGIQTEPSSLLYMRARYYSPELRRFINADPTGFGGGLNWYAYANNSPLMYVDASGEHPILVLALVGGITNVAVGAGIAAVTGQDYGWGDAALDFGIGAVFGGASGATINAARFYRAARFTFSGRSRVFNNVRRSLQTAKWNVLPRGQPIHHWLIPQRTWGRFVPNSIKNQPWNLMPARNRAWHDALHGKGGIDLGLTGRLWHGSPTWAKPATIGTGISLGNHASRTWSNWNSSGFGSNGGGSSLGQSAFSSPPITQPSYGGGLK